MFRLNSVLIPFFHCRFEGTNPDSDGSEIVSFVNLENRIQFIGMFEDFLHLVGRHRIHAASEGIELDKFHPVCSSCEIRRFVQS